jgi:hypothetical protein
MKVVEKDGKSPTDNNELDLSPEGIMNLEPDENGQVKLTQEQMEEMMALQQPPNPYTHELNFDGIKTLEDVIEVLKSFQISIDPAQWDQDSKYIKLKED